PHFRNSWRITCILMQERFASFGINNGKQDEGVREMKSGWRRHERAVTLVFDKQTVSAPPDIRRNATAQTLTEPKRTDKREPTSLLLRSLYWTYGRRLLREIEQGPMPRHIGVILDGNRRHARNEA